MHTFLPAQLLASVLLTGVVAIGGGVSASADRALSDGADEVVLDDFSPPGRETHRSVDDLTTPATRSPLAVDDLTNLPTAGAGDHSGADDLKGGPGCSIQCITSGVAYARGVGAELMVETDTAARIWIIVWNEDGYHRIVDTGGDRVHSFAVRFDDLEPGSTYSAMAAAEDAAGYTAHADGSFTTRERNVEIVFSTVEISEQPYSDDEFGVHYWIDGAWLDEAGEWVDLAGSTLDLDQPAVALHDVDRTLDLAVQVATSDESVDVCESPGLPGPEPFVFQTDCYTWASAFLEWDDLDDRPAEATSWTEHTLQRTLVLPGGNALPGGYGSALKFTVPVTLLVTYT